MKINTLCKEQGYVYIEVPNIRHYALSWHDSIYLAHLSCFSSENLKMLLVKNNLIPIYETYPQTDNGEVNLGILAKKGENNFKINKILINKRIENSKKILRAYSMRKSRVYFKKFPVNINVNLINDISLMIKPIPKIFKNILKNIYIRDVKLNKVNNKFEIIENNFKNEKMPNRTILKNMRFLLVKNDIKVY